MLQSLLCVHLCVSADGAINVLSGKNVSTGIATFDKKNRHKRAAKDEPDTPKMKKIKVSQDVNSLYDKFVGHGRRLKQQKKKKDAIP